MKLNATEMFPVSQPMQKIPELLWIILVHFIKYFMNGRVEDRWWPAHQSFFEATQIQVWHLLGIIVLYYRPFEPVFCPYILCVHIKQIRLNTVP